MPRRTLLLAALLILLSGAAITFAAISENTGVALNATVSLTGPDGVCKTVTNNSPTGKQVYVPASTAAEWQSFVASPPSGVTLAACVQTWAPASHCTGTYIGLVGSYDAVGTEQQICLAACNEFTGACCEYRNGSRYPGYFGGPVCTLYDGGTVAAGGDAEAVMSNRAAAQSVCSGSWNGGKWGPVSNSPYYAGITWYDWASTGLAPWNPYPSAAQMNAKCARACEMAGAKSCTRFYGGFMDDSCLGNRSGSYYTGSGGTNRYFRTCI